MIIQKLNFQKVDVSVIAEEIQKYLEAHPFKETQVCLNDCATSQEFDAYDGCGTLFDFQNNVFRRFERDFVRWAPSLENSEILNLKKKLEEAGYKIGRTRIMKLESRRCYSFHHDSSQRIHLAIKTNPQAALLFPPNMIIHVPSDGHLYMLDTRKLHSAMNGGIEERLHLVFSLAEES